MSRLSLISILVLTSSLLNYVYCWVFTDVNYNDILRNIGDEMDNEITDEELKQLKFSLIYPGTKWCGPGNVASSYEDLGSERQTDLCCRTHDNCPDLLTAGETKWNLTNNAYYTRLSCQCDEEFRSCLHNASSSAANQIGTVYFDALGTKCFALNFPIKGCKRRGGWFNKKCLQYSFNTNREKIVQWFDVPNY